MQGLGSFIKKSAFEQILGGQWSVLQNAGERSIFNRRRKAAQMPAGGPCCVREMMRTLRLHGLK